MRRVVVAGWVALLSACPKGQVGESTGEVTGAESTGLGVSTTTAAPTTGGPTGSGGESSGGTSTGGSTSVGESTGTGGSTSTGTGGSTGTSTGGSTSTGESTGGSSSTGEAPLLFDCFGCTCDANLSFCRQVFAGFTAPVLEACPVVPEEGLGNGCVLYPVDCDPPSCDCLPLMNGGCFCTEQAPGAFEVTCPLP
jgi:hypothetical protein